MTEPTDPDTLAVDAEDGASVGGPDSVDPLESEVESAAGVSPDMSVETLVADLERVTVERDTYLNDLQRVSAEFANYRKQAIKRQEDLVEHAAAGLAEKLLPVLDACEAAIAAGSTDVGPVHNTLVDILRREGMTQVSGVDEPFDPNLHEAVLHEDAEGAHVVAEVLRAGYAWHDRTLRAAMVRTRGTA
jgi:molecular chaperone GrpE